MKLRKVLTVLILISLINSCKTLPDDYQVYGKYEAKKRLNLFDILFMRYRIASDSIFLSRDSTFYYSNCAIIQTGRWKVIDNKLFLICEDRRYIVDSLNKIDSLDTLSCKIPKMYFKITKNHLRRKDDMGFRYALDFRKLN